MKGNSKFSLRKMLILENKNADFFELPNKLSNQKQPKSKFLFFGTPLSSICNQKVCSFVEKQRNRLVEKPIFLN